MGIGQNWVEEEHETEKYSEPVGAVTGARRGDPRTHEICFSVQGQVSGKDEAVE